MKCNPAVKDIFDYLQSIAPFEAQCEWDNSGLLVGEPSKEINKIGVVLDITADAIEYASKNGIDLIISHHPVIFRPVKNFLDGNPAYMLARNGISAICAHTSLDIAKGGVNDALAAALGFDNVSEFSECGETAMIRICSISAIYGRQLAKLVADKLSTGVAVADGGKIIKTVALCGGAGGDFCFEVAEKCDAFITGEVKHHEFLAAKEMGLTLIAAGHFETENPVVSVLADKIKAEFDCEVEIIPQNSPVKYFY